MEEAPSLSENHAEKPTLTNPGTEPATETQKPPPLEPTESAAVPPSSGPQTTKKRKVENGDYRNSTFFKIRKIVKDLRPYFIEVMHAPNFQESKAADEIRKQMQNMMDLTKQLQMELKEIENSKKPTEHENPSYTMERKATPLAGESNTESMERKQEEKQTRPPLHEKAVQKPDKELKVEAAGLGGTYVIGGSPLGWNFTMFPGTFSVYYGESKTRFRSRQAVKSVKG